MGSKLAHKDSNLEMTESEMGELEISWKELNETVNHIANR